MRSKKIFGMVVALTTLAVLVFAFIGTTYAEMQYPGGTRWSTDVSFPVSSLSRSRIVADINSAASSSKGTVYLLKADPDKPDTDLVLYDFSAHDKTSSSAKTADTALRFLRPGRHGSIRPGARLGSASPSGTYYFTDARACSAFTRQIRRKGATVLNACAENEQSRWLISPSNGTNGILAVVAFAVLSAALVWSWAGALAQSQRIRLLNGVPAGRISLEDAAGFAGLYVPVAAAVVAAGMVVGLVLGGFGPSTGFFITQSLGTTVVLGLVLCVFAFLASLLLHPRVIQIIRRRNNALLSRWGSTLFKFICFVLVLVALPQTITVSSFVSAQYQAVSRWRTVANAVSVQLTRQGLSDSYNDRFVRLYRTLAGEGKAALNMSVASMVVPDRNIHGNGRERTYSIPGDYSDIVMVDESFMRVMKLPVTDLEKIDPSTEPKGFRADVIDRLKEYTSVWDDGSKTLTLQNRLYEWKGKTAFPVLGAAQSTDPSQISYARKPLIVYLDRSASQHLGKDFVPAAIGQGTIFFTDHARLARQIQAEGLGPAVRSTLSVADGALLEAQRMGQEIIAGIVSVIVAMAALVLCGTQSAWIWAYERRRAIFLRHTAGQGYLGILGPHLLVQAGLMLAIGIGLSVTWLWKSAVPHPLLLVCSIAVVCWLIEMIAGIRFSEKAFVSVVERQE